jgi:hypothetical protein
LSVNNAINNIVKENARIDIQVNNAGYDLFDAYSDFPTTTVTDPIVAVKVRICKVTTSYDEIAAYTMNIIQT